MLKLFPKYLNFKNISKKCIRVPGPLEILQNLQENTCARDSLLIKLQAQVFSCEFCEISKNTYFYRTPLVATSDHVNNN